MAKPPFCPGFMAEGYYSLWTDCAFENALPGHEFTSMCFVTIKHARLTKDYFNSNSQEEDNQNQDNIKEKNSKGKDEENHQNKSQDPSSKDQNKQKENEKEKESNHQKSVSKDSNKVKDKVKDRDKEKEKEKEKEKDSEDGFSLFGKKKEKGMEIKSGSLITKITTTRKLEDLYDNTSNMPPETLDHTYLFFNVNKTINMIDMTEDPKYIIEQIILKQKPTCLDVNLLTRSNRNVELLIGIATGEILLLEIFSQRTKIFKTVTTNSYPVEIKWVPGSENEFVAIFTDGTLLVYDKDQDDQPFSVQIEKNPSFRVVTPPNPSLNPKSCWIISSHSLRALEFSRDCRHLAIVGKDGYLRIFDYIQRSLVVSFQSYFGGLSCVCWSPDGKYLLTGGEDDLVSVWNFEEKRIVARCEGHQSWVTGVSFDGIKCDNSSYRFGSVGDDTKLLIWDFTPHAISRSRAFSRAATRNRRSSQNQRSLSDPHSELKSGPIFVEALPRAEVPVIGPISAKKIHIEPLCSLGFLDHAIVTSCRRGRIKTWKRPENQPAQVSK